MADVVAKIAEAAHLDMVRRADLAYLATAQNLAPFPGPAGAEEALRAVRLFKEARARFLFLETLERRTCDGVGKLLGGGTQEKMRRQAGKRLQRRFDHVLV